MCDMVSVDTDQIFSEVFDFFFFNIILILIISIKYIAGSLYHVQA